MRKELLIALAVVLAGCTVPSFGGSDHPATPTGDDAIGYESGYWYDDSVSVTTDDGLNETEREAVVARTMARVEQVRDLEFKEPVPVSVISRAEYQNRSGGNEGGGSSRPQDPWNDQVWEALLLIGEDSGSSDEIDDTLSTTVQGYYSPSEDEIVIVSPTETPQIDRRTLSHELVHALQDQHFGLNGSAETQDTQLSRQGVTEARPTTSASSTSAAVVTAGAVSRSRTGPVTTAEAATETTPASSRATTRGCSPSSTSRTSPGRGSSTRCALTAAGTPSTPSTTTSPTAPSRCSIRRNIPTKSP